MPAEGSAPLVAPPPVAGAAEGDWAKILPTLESAIPTEEEKPIKRASLAKRGFEFPDLFESRRASFFILFI